MASGGVAVFFYGLFMDPDLLRSKGFHPSEPELGWVDGFALRIGDRATLVAQDSACTHGIVMSLTQAELDRLYSEPSVRAYRPQPVLVQLVSGAATSAISYNLPEAALASERNPEYAQKLRTVADKVGLPADYIASLQ